MRPSCKNRLNWPEFTWVINHLYNQRWLELFLYSWLRTVWLDQFIRFHCPLRFILWFLHAVTQKWLILNTLKYFFSIADSYDCAKHFIQVSVGILKYLFAYFAHLRFIASFYWFLCISGTVIFRLAQNSSVPGLYKTSLSLLLPFDIFEEDRNWKETHCADFVMFSCHWKIVRQISTLTGFIAW